MKTISSLSAIFVIALFASPAPAGQQVPLNGSFTSNETYDALMLTNLLEREGAQSWRKSYAFT
ncbi:MAG TPA: hypothetical protein VE486_01340 [Candidatus Baltobacteraceae bacterium]|jgi:hypothetical protein|nr:hypothetical protein [Candidatus Baltobacteraceae bacterium]